LTEQAGTYIASLPGSLDAVFVVIRLSLSSHLIEQFNCDSQLNLLMER
jgi:hypothetical protein